MNNSLILAKKYLNLNTGDDGFVIGSLSISDNEDMIIEIVERYYNHINGILQTTEKELNATKDLFDYSFQKEVTNKIKLRFFPRYSDFNNLFHNKNNYRNENLSELSYWAQNDNQRDNFIAGYKATKELYCKLVKGRYTPKGLKELITNTVPISLSHQDTYVHTAIVSKTDTGKSTLILELVKNILDRGESSLIVLEPHGDLSQDIAKLTKRENLVYLDPFLNSEFSPTINIFDIKNITADNISIYTSLIVNTFKQIIGVEFSVNMHSLITPMIAVLLQIPNTSFYDMLKFLDDKQNKGLLEYGKNNALIASHRLFFQTQFSEARYSTTKFSIAGKLNILLQDSVFSNLLTGDNTLNLEELINTKGKVIVIRLNTIKMIETIEAIGRFLLAIIVSYAFQRENINIKNRVPCYLFIDEGSMFLGDSIELILAQARKFRLYLLIAIQNNAQLTSSINASILSNTSLKFVGMNSHKNHSIMSKEINVSIDELNSLTQKGEFYLKIGSNKAFKFRVSNRLFNKKVYHSDYEFSKITKEQIKKYYRKINLDNIQYADVKFSSIEYKKPYSKQTTQELLSEVPQNDNELLDY